MTQKKSILKMATILSLFALSNSINATNIAKASYQVIPLPNEIALQQGESFKLNNKTNIVYSKQNKKMKHNAQFLQSYLKETLGIKCKIITENNSNNNVIILKSNLPSTNSEAYQISINNQSITINGASEAGCFYGIQTIRKSLQVKKMTTFEFPAVTINDAPRFTYRGMMLDVARHFFTLDELKQYIDILALHNANNLHIHLTDDQGWRLEIKKYPLLTKIGSHRDETVIGHNTANYDGKPYGGFYTQKEIKDIISYATDRYINIIPEIDMPGHMQAALAAYPEMGCTGGPYKVLTKWGISDDVLCVGNDKTLEFIKNVLDEITQIFPSKIIHIGGDECPKSRWKECPKCQARIQSLGITTQSKHSTEEQLQSYFIRYAEQILNAKGRQIIGWDEILEGGIAPNAKVMSWRGMKGGIEAAKQNHDVVMSPTNYCYYDYYQTNDTQSEPLAIGGNLPVKVAYEWDPVPSELTDEQKSHILGAQANLWTEYVPSFSQAEYMVLPRMAALTEVQWMKPDAKNYDSFLLRLPQLVEFYKLYNYNYAKHVVK